MSGARDEDRRKWLPSEAYRVLVLAALQGSREPVSKTRLAREVRANHYVVTTVLRALAQERLVEVHDGGRSGYRISVTAAGTAWLASVEDYIRQTYGARLARHFLYGKRPGWSERWLRPADFHEVQTKVK